MSRDRFAVAVMKATGAKYQSALTEVRRRELLSELGSYMVAVRALPERLDDQRRCVTCLLPYAPDHECPTPHGRTDGGGR